MRVYSKGRSTTGWEKAEKITALSQLAVGDIIISVSHQFKAENLKRVTKIGTMPVGFYWEYVEPVHGQTINGNDNGFVHEFMLDMESNEYYKATGSFKRLPVLYPPIPEGIYN